ncbi:LytTR family DNA-binding domain-containing protein [Sphingomonas psychrotolerans]|nr:LytTR family transcriptional regulator DNA-binding domain-containing protein [Sphingomonas psychrotolerans]
MRRLHFEFQRVAETVSRSFSQAIASLRASRTVSVALIALFLIFAGYAAAFVATLDQSIGSSVFYAVNNTVGIGLAGAGFYQLLARFVLRRRPAVAAVLHVPLAVAFALSWYLCTIVSFGLTPSWIRAGISVAPFGPVALAWQMFQGVTLYAALALFAYWRDAMARLESLRAGRTAATDQATSAPPPARETVGSLLVRCDREVVPVALNHIVIISGVDGYAEVVTNARRLLSTTTLARFEAILPLEQFVRVHRSHIARLGAIRHAEPAGNGKLLLHMENGDMVSTSRTGARALKERAV